MRQNQRLLLDWQKSNSLLQDKLIIAVNNRNVDNLNEAVRELLKADKMLVGAEYQVSRRKVGDKASTELCFMQGERVVFNETNKELGINNGDFGSLVEVSKDRFMVKLDNGQEVRFHPNEFSGFKHGYASTIYKSQGASIKDVYVLHDGFSTMQNSYVALSRHVEDVHLYVNSQATKSLNHLVHQLGFDAEKATSISFLTKEELLQREQEQSQQEEQGLLVSIGKKISGYTKQKLTSLVDKYKVNSEYYVFERPAITQSQVEEMLELVNEVPANELVDSSVIASNNDLVVAGSERMVAGGQASVDSKTRMTAKQRFYANVAYQNSKASSTEDREKVYQQEIAMIRSQIKFNAERIAISLLGVPNKYLSNGTSLRYGEHGKLAIRLRGEKAGNWYNFAEEKGGDMLGFIQHHKGISFAEAVEFAKNIIANDNIKLDVEGLESGLDKQIFLRNKGVSEDSETNANHSERLAKVQEVYAKSKAISMTSSEIDFRQVKTINYLPSDNLNNILQEQVLDAISSFVVDNDADITGIYLARLDKELTMIEQSGYTEDFLIAANIARVCQHFGIRYEIRGSSSSSLVARALNIHKIDPIKHDLLFERFLGSGNQPDFDFDIDSSRKHLVENYLMYAYQGRAGKMMMLKDGKLTPHVCAWGIKDVASIVNSGGLGSRNDEAMPICNRRALSDDVTNFSSMDYNSLEINNGMFTIDYNECKEVKKFDLLSSKELGRLSQIAGQSDISDKITMQDSKTYQLIASGDVKHLFQINQSASICRQLSPKNFNDLVNLLAVIRPGARHNIKILSGKEAGNIVDPLGLFNSTKGTILFQEQVMQAANQYFAIPLEQTNQFRKDLAVGEIDKDARSKYIANSSLATVSEAQQLFVALEKASKFVYNKAHAVSYAYATYKSAYAKANYRDKFDKIYADKDNVTQLTKDATIQQAEFIARGYLVNHRAIKGQLPEDIRVTYQQRAGKIMPMIVAFAHNSQGEITGMQSIYLDKITGTKINKDIGLAKRSLGQIKGSFVEVQKTVIVNSGEFGARNDGATPISNHTTGQKM